MDSYSNDYNDLVCPMRNHQRWAGDVWAGMLWDAKYVGTYKLFLCPSHTAPAAPADPASPTADEFYLQTSYGLNGDTFGNGSEDTNYWGGFCRQGIKRTAIASFRERSPDLLWVHDSRAALGGAADMGSYMRYRHNGNRVCNMLAFGGHVTTIRNPRPGIEEGINSSIPDRPLPPPGLGQPGRRTRCIFPDRRLTRTSNCRSVETIMKFRNLLKILSLAAAIGAAAADGGGNLIRNGMFSKPCRLPGIPA